MTRRMRLSFIALAGLVALSALLFQCSQPTNPGTSSGNIAPETRLSNLPINDPAGTLPSATPTVTLSWVGDDPDGFVTGFRYRWSYMENGVSVYRPWTTVLNVNVTGVCMIVYGNTAAIPDVYHYFVTLAPSIQDSVLSSLTAGNPVFVAGDTVYAANAKHILNPNVGVFVFESLDTLNQHIFEVKAVDNMAVEDPTPASVTFWTPKAIPPDTRLVEPYPSDSTFMIDKVTETFPGLKFYYEGLDLKSKGLEYSWSVDSLAWSPYSTKQVAVVTASDMKPPYTGPHTFYVRARNDYALEDPTPAKYSFQAIVPAFVNPSTPHRILVLNCTRNGTGTVGFPSSVQMNAFYSDILNAAGKTGGFDVWTMATERKFPSRLMLANYTSLIIHNDAQNGDLIGTIDAPRALLFSEYLSIGGKLIVSGWKLFSRIDTTFQEERFHIWTFSTSSFYRLNNDYDFVGGTGQLGYPDVALDTTLFRPIWAGALDQVPIVSPRGFAEVIFRYQTKSLNPLFQNGILGIRYLGITYSVIYLGFPLYYAQRDNAIAVMKKSLQDIGE